MENGKAHKDEKNNQNCLHKVNLRNNQLKGNIILGNYGVSCSANYNLNLVVIDCVSLLKIAIIFATK